MIGIGKMKQDFGDILKGEEVQILTEYDGMAECLIESRNKRVSIPLNLIDEDNA